MIRALLAALLLIGIAACSNDDDSPTAGAGNSFADATCADLAAWAAAVRPAFDDLGAVGNLDPSDKATFQAQLDKIGRELDGADAATARLADGIDARPAPDISSGDTIKKTVVDALRQMRELAKSTRAEITAFDINTATEEQASKLKNSIGLLAGQIASSLSVLAPLLTNNQDLRDALENSATCQQAGSSLSAN